MASHLYKVGHVTHNWQQMAFLQEIFNKEDALRAEVDHFGTTHAKRSTMLDWDEFSQSSSRVSNKSTGRRSTARSVRSSSQRIDDGEKCGDTYRSFSSSTSSGSYSSRSSGSFGSISTGRSSGELTKRSSSSLSTHRNLETGRSSMSQFSGITARSMLSTGSQSSKLVESLRRRKKRLQSKLEKLEKELSTIGEEEEAAQVSRPEDDA